MKKLLTILLALTLLILGCTSSVFSDEFVSSPTVKEHNSVKIVEGIEIAEGGSFKLFDRNDGCVDKIVLTPYEFKDNIEKEKSLLQIEEAYKEIENASSLAELTPRIEEIADSKLAKVEDLAVRYLFDVTIYEDISEEKHDDSNHNTYVELHVEADTLDNFVCVMLYQDGKWIIVDDVVLDPTDPTRMYLPIITGSASYAVVVANEFNKDVIACACGDCCCIVHWIVLIMALTVALIMSLTATKKKDKEDDEDDKKVKEEDEDEENKDDTRALVKLIRILILLINAVIAIILVFLLNICHCKYDIPAFIINIIICLLAYFLIKQKADKKDKDEEENS